MRNHPPKHHSLSWHHPHEAGVSPLPHEGSHTQGNHDAEYAPHSTENPMKPADRMAPGGRR
jgi:hypothetical protein